MTHVTKGSTPTTTSATLRRCTPAQTTGNPRSSTLADVLRQILAEVTPGQRPYSSDSYLPEHLIKQAQAALDKVNDVDFAAQQQAFNAMSTASWHCARGELPQALARLRRAKSHITAMMEGGAA